MKFFTASCHYRKNRKITDINFFVILQDFFICPSIEKNRSRKTGKELEVDLMRSRQKLEVDFTKVGKILELALTKNEVDWK